MRPDTKIALITGAGSGIGRALALEASSRGLTVVMVGRRGDKLNETASMIDRGNTVLTLPADLTDRSDRTNILAQIKDRFGRLDYLVNNAGSVAVGPFQALDDQAMTDLFAVNVLAPACLIREAIPLLRRSGAGRIVNIGSMFGDIAFPQFALYSASKYALRGLSNGLRRELKADGIGVTYAAPRATRTPAARSFEPLAKPMGMTFDTPERVAHWIWSGVFAERDNLYPGLTERFAVLAQTFIPGLLDRHFSRIEQTLRNRDDAPTVAGGEKSVP
ncbi:MAG: SDR family NAD(P)-dependent oxidoreductase [Alphaproteobacteria bacterium]